MDANESNIFNDILRWSEETFPKRTKDGRPTGIISHLIDEFQELAESDFTDIEEMADIGFMLIQLAEARGGNLENALRFKLEKNKARVWPKEPDENGVYKHVAV